GDGCVPGLIEHQHEVVVFACVKLDLELQHRSPLLTAWLCLLGANPAAADIAAMDVPDSLVGFAGRRAAATEVKPQIEQRVHPRRALDRNDASEDHRAVGAGGQS